MARVTVEDCITKIPNRFELVMSAAQRTRDISAGAEITLDRDNDKNPVVSLREIAEETVSVDSLKESLIRGSQRMAPSRDEEEEDAADDGDDAALVAEESADALADALSVRDDSTSLDAAGALAFQDEVEIDDED